jgi:ApaG protein
MSQSCQTVELEGLRVTVDRLVYRRLPPGTTDRPNSFVYFISIHNGSDVPVTLRGRKWVVTHDDGEVTIVEGDGVVGKLPRIEPGGRFSYNSQHLIHTLTAVAEGSYLGMDDQGRPVVIRIPCFRMTVPS